MGFLDFGRKMVSKATNNNVANAKALPGGKSLGKSIRNAPGMAVNKPAVGGLAPSPSLQPTPAPPVQSMQEPPPQAMQLPAPAPAPSPMPSMGESMGEAMGRPAVMPPQASLQNMPQMNEGGLGPQAALLNQRMGMGSRPIRRPMR